MLRNSLLQDFSKFQIFQQQHFQYSLRVLLEANKAPKHFPKPQLKNQHNSSHKQNQNIFRICYVFQEYTYYYLISAIINNQNMCFVKTLVYKQVQAVQSAFKLYPEQNSTFIEAQSQNSGISISEKSQVPNYLNMVQTLLLNNSMIIQDIEKSIQTLTNKLENISESVENFEEKQFQTQQLQEISEVDPLINNIFGNKTYHYQLILEEPFQPLLYKERNFNIMVRLANSSGQTLRNANLIHLCFGIATTQGIWVHQNKAGEPIIKGKNEVDLYQGKSSFEKVYLREVSRNFPEGIINIVVYPKPSTIKYSQSTGIELQISQEQIMPLLIKDVVVKAKKK